MVTPLPILSTSTPPAPPHQPAGSPLHETNTSGEDPLAHIRRTGRSDRSTSASTVDYAVVDTATSREDLSAHTWLTDRLN